MSNGSYIRQTRFLVPFMLGSIRTTLLRGGKKIEAEAKASCESDDQDQQMSHVDGFFRSERDNYRNNDSLVPKMVYALVPSTLLVRFDKWVLAYG